MGLAAKFDFSAYPERAAMADAAACRARRRGRRRSHERRPSPPAVRPAATRTHCSRASWASGQFAANIFNYTVGSGIFSLPAFAVIGLGSAAPLAYVACAIVIGLVVLCFAESGSRVSSTGGAYAYVETALGPMTGFVAGCLVFTTGWFAAAAVITAVVRSLLALTSGAPAWVTQVLMVVVVAILVTLNMRGVRTGARLLETITVVKLVPLLVFVGIGVFFIDTSESRLDERAGREHGAEHRGHHHLRVLGHRRRDRTERRSEESGAHRAARDPAGARRRDGAVSRDSVRGARHHGTGAGEHRQHAARRSGRRGARARRRARS